MAGLPSAVSLNTRLKMERLHLASELHFNAVGLKVLGMARSFGTPLAELFDVIHRHTLVPSQMQEGVLEHATMAWRKHETIAVHPLGILRIVLHLFSHEEISDWCLTHGSTWMATVGFVHGIHSQEADGIDALGLHIHFSCRSKANHLLLRASLGRSHSCACCQGRCACADHAGSSRNSTGRCWCGHWCWCTGHRVQLLSVWNSKRTEWNHTIFRIMCCRFYTSKVQWVLFICQVFLFMFCCRLRPKCCWGCWPNKSGGQHYSSSASSCSRGSTLGASGWHGYENLFREWATEPAKCCRGKLKSSPSKLGCRRHKQFAMNTNRKKNQGLSKKSQVSFPTQVPSNEKMGSWVDRWITSPLKKRAAAFLDLTHTDTHLFHLAVRLFLSRTPTAALRNVRGKCWSIRVTTWKIDRLGRA